MENNKLEIWIRLSEFITEDNAAPMHWPLDRVVLRKSGPDKFVRVVKLNRRLLFERPVAKLRKFTIEDANST